LTGCGCPGSGSSHLIPISAIHAGQNKKRVLTGPLKWSGRRGRLPGNQAVFFLVRPPGIRVFYSVLSKIHDQRELNYTEPRRNILNRPRLRLRRFGQANNRLLNLLLAVSDLRYFTATNPVHCLCLEVF